MVCPLCNKTVPPAEANAYHGHHEDCYIETNPKQYTPSIGAGVNRISKPRKSLGGEGTRGVDGKQT